MSSAGPRSAGRRGRDEAGFILVALLMLLGVMTSLAMTYSRHVIVQAESSELASSIIEAEEVIDSQIEYVIQAHAAGTAVSSSAILDAVHSEAERHGTSLAVSPLTDGHFRMHLSAITPSGMGATRLVELELGPDPLNTTPDTLPRLEDTLRGKVVADSSIPKTDYSSSTVVEDAELKGLLVVHDGVELTLRNVLVYGAIVSADALSSDDFGAYSAVSAPRVVIDGNVRIIAGSDLDGLAVVMPDGALSTSNADARLQVRGDIVAHTVQLGCPGSTQGNIACVDPLVMHADQERVGSTRAPPEWSPALDHHGAWRTRSLAFVPRHYSVAELTPVTSHKPTNLDNAKVDKSVKGQVELETTLDKAGS